jgi:hypothetical protein
MESIICCEDRQGKIVYLSDTLGPQWTVYRHMALKMDAWQAEEWLASAGYAQTAWIESIKEFKKSA